jgi:hypothetical protein
MVKAQKTSKKRPPPQRMHAPVASKLGRPYGDPDDLRSERLTLRIHPDLMSVLVQRAREAGLTRSLYVERILIEHTNRVEGASLDMIGRWQHDPAVDASLHGGRDPRRPLQAGLRAAEEWRKSKG